jgi:hypothetical protein
MIVSVVLPARLLSALVGLLVVSPSLAMAAAPTLTHLFPAGGQRGQKVAVTCTGNFAWPVQVRAMGADVQVLSESGKLELTIPADLPTDRIWVQLYNAEGISAARPFLIDSLPEVLEKEPNDAPDESQLLETSSAIVNGVLEKGGAVDSFALQLTAGQTLVADLDAHDRLGSPMDAIVQVVSESGFVLADQHDDVGLDPRFSYRVPRDGKYLVRVFGYPSNPDTTIAFRGAADYIYRLTLTTGPFISHASPAAVSRDEPGTVAVQGWNLPVDARLPVQKLGGARWADFVEFESWGDARLGCEDRIGFVYSPDWAGSARVRLLPQIHQPTPDPATDGKVPLQVPASVTACLTKPKQVDRYVLPLNKGQAIVIAIESHGLQQQLQPFVKLLDPEGKVVAKVDAPKLADGVFSYTAAADATYQLEVSDLFQHGGAQFWYRLGVREESPDFELATAVANVELKAGATVELDLTLSRRKAPRGAVEAVTVEAMNLPAGVTAEPVTVDAKTDKLKLKLVAAADAAAFSGPLRILGKAAMPENLQRMARSPELFGSRFDQIWLTVIAASP